MRTLTHMHTYPIFQITFIRECMRNYLHNISQNKYLIELPGHDLENGQQCIR